MFSHPDPLYIGAGYVVWRRMEHCVAEALSRDEFVVFAQILYQETPWTYLGLLPLDRRRAAGLLWS